MQRFLAALVATLAFVGSSQATGMLIPVEKKLPPLAMVDHKVNIAIEDQIAITRIEQTFRNHTDRNLEATYLLPVPKGASVRKFSMWVNGKEEPGELVEAKEARKIYNDIVARTMDPGLLEYVDHNLFKLRVFPVPPKGDQKISISYTSIAPSDNGLIEYVYPMKTDGKAAQTLEKFTLNVKLKSQHAITNLYSPSHAITISRPGEKEAIIGFEKDQALLDKDFQLYYTYGTKDIGLTALAHRPNPSQNGYFMMLLSPRAELSKSQQVPRDMIFVLDTSGSMRGKRLVQAKAALKYCLKNLNEHDRFGMVNFATTVNKYSDNLHLANANNIEAARKWVDELDCTGGTNIDGALSTALAMRGADESRTHTLVFFTDGRPTFGETNPDKIVQNVAKKNTANTRIFTFGVGDDVNAAMLDALADNSRAISTYVRENEDIEAKVSSLYAKISNPVLANLKIAISDGVRLSDVYPPNLPDLFHGNQLVVFGRYSGKGDAEIKLTGNIGKDSKEFVYKVAFAEKTEGEKNFVEDLWARRKVGFLLDQIRISGENKELVEEVTALAKRYGITTPYTSYLLVPDGPAPKIAAGGKLGEQKTPLALAAPGGFGGGSAGPAMKLEDFARQQKDTIANTRGQIEEKRLEGESKNKDDKAAATQAQLAQSQKSSLDQARYAFGKKQHYDVQNGKLGVDFAVQNNALRTQECLNSHVASRYVQNRNVVEVGGVWIDEGFTPKLESITVKAMSPAYFRMLERQPSVRDVLKLGNYVVWVTPSGRALIIDQGAGQEELADADIDRLFVPAVAPKK
jgi:Ca-activated chloride channel family protein